jgi:hypothetical protein
MAGKNDKILVWDVPVRLFHWLLVALMATSYFSGRAGGDWMQLHFWSGYAIMTLLFFRLVWGFVGSTTARFSSFLKVNAGDRAGAAAADQGRARHRQDRAGREIAKRAGAADRVAHQVDHQGAAGPLRVRRRQRACATASSATSEGQRHRQLHQARQAVGGLHRRRRAPCC